MNNHLSPQIIEHKKTTTYMYDVGNPGRYCTVHVYGAGTAHPSGAPEFTPGF
jgi:hypothetical protein